MSGVLAKCLQIFEIHHLKNNFQGIQKATKRKILVAFLFFIIYKFNAAFIETANKSVAMVLATSNVNGRALSLIIFLTLFPLNMSIDIVLYKWHKINVFVISFSLIIRFISVYPIFCKHIASTKSKIYLLI